MRKNLILLLATTALLTAAMASWAGSTYIPWKPLANGISYKKISLQNSTSGYLHAFRVDPKVLNLDIVTATEYGMTNAAIKTLAKKSRAMLAINGGFFTPEYKPLGLRIKSGKQINPVKGTKWWGIFEIMNGAPRMIKYDEFEMQNGISMAMQSGPRLVVNGQIPKLKQDLAERSAICQTIDNLIVIAATENAPISTEELAKLLRAPASEGGLECKNALNLDGGSSTQLYAKVKDFELYVMGIGSIVDGIGVYAK